MNNILFSSEKEDWETPKEVFDVLNKTFDFTLDPCASKENHKCKKYYTKEQDGLKQSWKDEKVFCNPPYGRELYKWVKKCADEADNNKALVVLLCPARTDTKWFHEFIWQKKGVYVNFIKGRLKFGNSKNSAPFPSMLVVFWK